MSVTYEQNSVLLRQRSQVRTDERSEESILSGPLSRIPAVDSALRPSVLRTNVRGVVHNSFRCFVAALVRPEGSALGLNPAHLAPFSSARASAQYQDSRLGVQAFSGTTYGRVESSLRLPCPHLKRES